MGVTRILGYEHEYWYHAKILELDSYSYPYYVQTLKPIRNFLRAKHWSEIEKCIILSNYCFIISLLDIYIIIMMLIPLFVDGFLSFYFSIIPAYC